MNISKQEAEESLKDIQSIIEQTRKALAYGTSSVLLMIWGLIWVIGYSTTQFLPAYAGYTWLGLVSAGTLCSWLIGASKRSSFRSANGSRIGAFWLILFAYACIWLTLLHTQTPTDRQIAAFFATVPMFAYVVGGLWLGRFFVWLGVFVTILTMVGFFFLHEWFFLWMAFTGGGSLIVAGLYIRNSWR